MTLELRELGLDERYIVSGITMDPGQEPFAGGSIDQVFAGFERSPQGCHPFALMDDDTALGFLVAREDAAIAAWVEKGCITLNNLRIDHEAQGLGYGKSALRLTAQWIQSKRPSVSHVMASVNVKNDLAMRFNLACGFMPTGRIIEGPLGQQQVICAQVDRLAKIQSGETSTRSL